MNDYRAPVQLIYEQQEYHRKFILELVSDYDASLFDHDDLNHENEQQSKLIRHLERESSSGKNLRIKKKWIIILCFRFLFEPLLVTE